MGCDIFVYLNWYLIDIYIREGIIILGYNVITPNGKVKKLRVANSEERSKVVVE